MLEKGWQNNILQKDREIYLTKLSLEESAMKDGTYFDDHSVHRLLIKKELKVKAENGLHALSSKLKQQY